MLPLDQNKHRSNSDTIQASKWFDFHEWAYLMWEMTRCTKHVLSKDVCHVNNLLSWIAQRRGMSYEWGVHQHIFEKSNMFNSSLACKTFSHPMTWWIYRQVDLRCQHSQCKCPLFVGDLIWNGGGHQCALFLHVEPDCWLTWLHSHCHIAMPLSWTWFQSHSKRLVSHSLHSTR